MDHLTSRRDRYARACDRRLKYTFYSVGRMSWEFFVWFLRSCRKETPRLTAQLSNETNSQTPFVRTTQSHTKKASLQDSSHLEPRTSIHRPTPSKHAILSNSTTISSKADSSSSLTDPPRHPRSGVRPWPLKPTHASIHREIIPPHRERHHPAQDDQRIVHPRHVWIGRIKLKLNP